jgi:hypothetical protein
VDAIYTHLDGLLFTALRSFTGYAVLNIVRMNACRILAGKPEGM